MSSSTPATPSPGAPAGDETKSPEPTQSPAAADTTAPDTPAVTEVFDPEFKHIFTVPSPLVVHLPPARLNITRLVVCRNYRPGDESSCSMGENCKFVHVDCDLATVESHPIHVNYIWRHESLCTYARLPAGETMEVLEPGVGTVVQHIPSDQILCTAAVEGRKADGDATDAVLTELRHCEQFYCQRMCKRGSACPLVHALYIDPQVKGEFKRAPARPLAQAPSAASETAGARASEKANAASTKASSNPAARRVSAQTACTGASTARDDVAVSSGGVKRSEAPSSTATATSAAKNEEEREVQEAAACNDNNTSPVMVNVGGGGKRGSKLGSGAASALTKGRNSSSPLEADDHFASQQQQQQRMEEEVVVAATKGNKRNSVHEVTNDTAVLHAKVSGVQPKPSRHGGTATSCTVQTSVSVMGGKVAGAASTGAAPVSPVPVDFPTLEVKKKTEEEKEVAAGGTARTVTPPQPRSSQTSQAAPFTPPQPRTRMTAAVAAALRACDVRMPTTSVPAPRSSVQQQQGGVRSRPSGSATPLPASTEATADTRDTPLFASGVPHQYTSGLAVPLSLPRSASVLTPTSTPTTVVAQDGTAAPHGYLRTQAQSDTSAYSFSTASEALSSASAAAGAGGSALRGISPVPANATMMVKPTMASSVGSAGQMSYQPMEPQQQQQQDNSENYGSFNEVRHTIVRVRTSRKSLRGGAAAAPLASTSSSSATGRQDGQPRQSWLRGAADTMNGGFVVAARLPLPSPVQTSVYSPKTGTGSAACAAPAASHTSLTSSLEGEGDRRSPPIDDSTCGSFSPSSPFATPTGAHNSALHQFSPQGLTQPSSFTSRQSLTSTLEPHCGGVWPIPSTAAASTTEEATRQGGISAAPRFAPTSLPSCHYAGHTESAGSHHHHRHALHNNANSNGSSSSGSSSDQRETTTSAVYVNRSSFSSSPLMSNNVSAGRGLRLPETLPVTSWATSQQATSQPPGTLSNSTNGGTGRSSRSPPPATAVTVSAHASFGVNETSISTSLTTMVSTTSQRYRNDPYRVSTRVLL